MVCQNSVNGCGGGIDPLPLCPACLIDLDRGRWWRETGKDFVLEYKKQASSCRSVIDMAKTCRTFEEIKIVLSQVYQSILDETRL